MCECSLSRGLGVGGPAAGGTPSIDILYHCHGPSPMAGPAAGAHVNQVGLPANCHCKCQGNEVMSMHTHRYVHYEPWPPPLALCLSQVTNFSTCPTVITTKISIKSGHKYIRN